MWMLRLWHADAEAFSEEPADVRHPCEGHGLLVLRHIPPERHLGQVQGDGLRGGRGSGCVGLRCCGGRGRRGGGGRQAWVRGGCGCRGVAVALAAGRRGGDRGGHRRGCGGGGGRCSDGRDLACGGLRGGAIVVPAARARHATRQQSNRGHSHEGCSRQPWARLALTSPSAVVLLPCCVSSWPYASSRSPELPHPPLASRPAAGGAAGKQLVGQRRKPDDDAVHVLAINHDKGGLRLVGREPALFLVPPEIAR